MIDKQTGDILCAWQPLGALSAGAFTGTIDVALMSHWGMIEIRNNAAPTDPLTHAFLTTNQAVGPVFDLSGQSQLANNLASATTLAVPISDAANGAYVFSKAVSNSTAESSRHLYTAEEATVYDGVSAMMNQMAALGVGPCWVVMNAAGGTGQLGSLNGDAPLRPYLAAGGNNSMQFKAGVVGSSRAIVIMQWLTAEAVEQANHGADYWSAILEGTGPLTATYTNLPAQNCRALYPDFDYIYMPGTRHVNTAAGSFDVTDSGGAIYHTARAAAVAHALANGYLVGVESADMELSDAFHQDGSSVRGNVLLGARVAMTVGRYVGLFPAFDPVITGASLTSPTTIRVDVAFCNGGALSCAAPGAVTGFEIAGSRAGFTAAVSGNTVVLSNTAGNWTGGEAITFLPGYPNSYGAGVSQGALLDGMLYETLAADVAGLGIPVGTWSGTVA